MPREPRLVAVPGLQHVEPRQRVALPLVRRDAHLDHLEPMMHRETCDELQNMMDAAQRDCLVLEDALNALGTTRRGDTWTLPVTASDRLHEALSALMDQYRDAVSDHDYAARGLTAKMFATPTMPTLSSVGWKP